MDRMRMLADSTSHRCQGGSLCPDTDGDIDGPVNPIAFWAREGDWPREYFQRMDLLLPLKKSLLANRQRWSCASSVTPSDQRPRGEKTAPYRDARYDVLLETKR
ncbi:hypothetical protein V8C34DRAFT_267722 [Trichoderma compactum]